MIISLGAGLLLGVPLALVGLRLTRFETTAEGHFYTPNTYIVVALSVLLVVSLIFRLFRLYSISPTTGLPYSDLTHSVPIRFLIGLLGSYYVAYYAGVLIRSQAQKPMGANPGFIPPSSTHPSAEMAETPKPRLFRCKTFMVSHLRS